MHAATKKNELMLDIMESLARSQRALSRLIENMAAVSDDSPQLSKQLLRNSDAISRYQCALAEKLAGLSFSASQRGTPGKAWIRSDSGIHIP